MRVPSPTEGRTRPSSQGLAYLRPAQIDMSAVGRGLENLGEAFAQADRRSKAEAERAARMKMDLSLDDLQIKAGESLNQQRQAADPADSNYRQRADETITNYINEFVAAQPPELQEEARVKAGALRIKHSFTAMAQEDELRTNYFNEAIKQKAENARVNMAQDPSRINFATLTRDLDTMIDGSGLDNDLKAEWKVKARTAIASILYKDEAKQEVVGGGSALDVIKHFEGFRDTPYWDVNANRVGYGSDTVTLPDGTVKPVDANTRVTVADADRDLARRVGEFQRGIAKDIGPDVWGALPDGAKAALSSVAYNYGSLPDSIVAAAKTGDVNTLANAVESLSANPDRRRQEAELIRNGVAGAGLTGLDDDPIYSDIPLEQRTALRQDAVKDYIEQQNLLASQRKAQLSAAQDELYMGLAQGRYGKSEIDRAEAAGLLDYKSWQKANNIYSDYVEDQSGSWAFGNKFLKGTGYEAQNAGVGPGASVEGTIAIDSAFTPAVFNPMSEQDKKQYNSYFNTTGGPAKLSQGDNAYFQNTIMPAVQATQDIPTDMAGIMTGLYRSTNPKLAGFALDALSRLRDEAPDAFRQRFSADAETNTAIDLWQHGRSYYDEETLLKMIRGGEDAAMRSARKFYYDQADDILTKSNHPNFIDTTKLVDEFSGGMFTGAAPLTNYYGAQPQLTSEFRTLFRDNYAKFNGNVDAAKKATLNLMRQQWQPTSIGGTYNLMKWGPETAGYKKMYGGYKWIEDNVRTELALQPGQQFQLISDEQTDREVSQFQRAGGRPPSYRVLVKGADGNWREARRPVIAPQTGELVSAPIARMYFEPTKVQLRKDQLRTQIDIERARLGATGRRLEEMMQPGVNVDEYMQNLTDRKHAVEKLEEDYNNLLPEPKEVIPPELQDEVDPFGGYKPVEAR